MPTSRQQLITNRNNAQYSTDPPHRPIRRLTQPSYPLHKNTEKSYIEMRLKTTAGKEGEGANRNKDNEPNSPQSYDAWRLAGVNSLNLEQ